MRVLTEIELRDQYRKQPFETISLPENSKLTPAAAQFLRDKRIKLNPVGNNSISSTLCPEAIKEYTPSIRTKEYRLPDGKVSKEKLEHMTQLRGQNLVDKRHPVIRLRGNLDSLQAQIIDTILDVRVIGFEQIAKELNEILGIARLVMRAEVTGEQLSEPTFMGMDSQTIREFSHHPEIHMGVKHFLPDPNHGRLMSKLNLLRTSVRETELVAARAFCENDGATSRSDIMQTLNRMSSMIYIMMCRLLAGKYFIGHGCDRGE